MIALYQITVVYGSRLVFRWSVSPEMFGCTLLIQSRLIELGARGHAVLVSSSYEFDLTNPFLPLLKSREILRRRCFCPVVGTSRDYEVTSLFCPLVRLPFT